MNVTDYLTEDGHVMLLLCSSFGLGEQISPAAFSPLRLSEWNQLAPKIRDSPLRNPSALPGQSAADLAGALQIVPEEADRLVRLLERGSRLAIELESLFSRGLWAVTRVDPGYPAGLRDTLKHQAPTVLFGAGDIHLLRRAGVAVVGSRDLDAAGAAFAQEVGRKAAAVRWPVVSGGARGTDRLAMQAALEAGSTALGVVADSLERNVRQPDVRQLLLDGQLVLLTSYAPAAGFSVGAAMGRNKIIYGLAEYAIVVSSDFETGGTWAGAVEALKAGWCPVYVRDGAAVPKGNRGLLKLGAAPMAEGDLPAIEHLPDWLNLHRATQPSEPDLFSFASGEASTRKNPK